MPSDAPRYTASRSPGNVGELTDAPKEAVVALRRGPIGALVVASIAVAILFIGWVALYFFLFIPRGPIG